MPGGKNRTLRAHLKNSNLKRFLLRNLFAKNATFEIQESYRTKLKKHPEMFPLLAVISRTIVEWSLKIKQNYQR